MRLQYYLPSLPMRDVLTIHAAVDQVEMDRVETLPAMLPNLHVRLSGESSLIFSDGRVMQASPVSLIGPTDHAYQVVLGKGCRIAVVGLLPAGWVQLIGEAGCVFADTVVDGSALWGNAASAELVERLQSLVFDGGHITHVESFLKKTSINVSGHRLRQVAAIDHWLEYSRTFSLDDLCTELEFGARQLRRVTLDCYGVSPKTLAMKYRALRLAARLSQASTVASPATFESYADQSHMIRDFRRFVGWTPAAFVRDHQNIAAATLSGRRQAGAARQLVLLS